MLHAHVICLADVACKNYPSRTGCELKAPVPLCPGRDALGCGVCCVPKPSPAAALPLVAAQTPKKPHSRRDLLPESGRGHSTALDAQRKGFSRKTPCMCTKDWAPPASTRHFPDCVPDINQWGVTLLCVKILCCSLGETQLPMAQHTQQSSCRGGPSNETWGVLTISKIPHPELIWQSGPGKHC